MEREGCLAAPNRYLFIHYLRTIAVIMILWDHLIPGGYAGMGVALPVSIIDRYIIWPLAITNYFGALGVDIFFIITGFLTLNSLRETGALSFSLKRVERLLPALAISYICYYSLPYIIKIFVPYEMHVFPDYWSANGSLWQLKVLAWFYVIFACCIYLMKKHLFAGILVFQLAVVAICELTIREYIPFQIGIAFSYVFYIAIGMGFYFLFVRHGRFIGFLLSFLLSWYGIIHYNIGMFNPERAETGNSFGVSAMYAILIFLVFFLANDRLHYSKFADKCAEYSYGLYVHHMPFFTVILYVMMQNDHGMSSQRLLCWTIALITILLSVGVTYLQIKLVDPPCKKMLYIALRSLKNGKL